MKTINKKKIRVAMLISKFLPNIGGAEIQCLNISNTLSKYDDIEVDIITPRENRNSPKFEFLKKVPVKRIPFLHPAELNIFIWLAYLFKYRKSYDIFHIHLINRPHTMAAWIISKIFNKKTIVKLTSTGSGFDLLLTKRLRPPLNLFTESAVRSADKIIAISKQTEIELLNYGINQNKIEFIPNGVTIKGRTDSKTRNKCRNKFNLPKDKIIILRTGRFSKVKGISCLLEGFEIVLKYCPNAFLLSVGGNNFPKDIINYANNRKENSLFLEDKSDVEPFYQSADIFVLPSLREGLSNSLLEAQAAALPAVVTSVGGNTDIIKDGINGIVVEPNNHVSLASALIKLVKSKDLRQEMACKAVQCINKYDINTIADKYRRLYKQLADAKNLSNKT